MKVTKERGKKENGHAPYSKRTKLHLNFDCFQVWSLFHEIMSHASAIQLWLDQYAENGSQGQTLDFTFSTVSSCTTPAGTDKTQNLNSKTDSGSGMR